MKDYLKKIRSTYDDRCFYFIDKVYDCAAIFIDSLKTNVATEYKNSLIKYQKYLNQIDRGKIVSQDQIFDIIAVCNGAIRSCFQSIKPPDLCEGSAFQKAFNCSLQDYVYYPSKYFRCDENWEVKMKASSQSSNKSFRKFSYSCHIIMYLNILRLNI